MSVLLTERDREGNSPAVECEPADMSAGARVVEGWPIRGEFGGFEERPCGCCQSGTAVMVFTSWSEVLPLSGTN